jgi:hypothetical protein
MSYIILSPAHGRDYKSAKAAKADFDMGRDFCVESIFSGGWHANKTQLAGYTCEIRYNQFRSLVVVKVGGAK